MMLINILWQMFGVAFIGFVGAYCARKGWDMDEANG